MKSLQQLLEDCHAEIRDIDEELLTLPSGRLRKNSTSFYHVDKGKEVGISRNRDMVRALARKKYLEIRKRCLENLLSGSNKVLEPLDIIESLPPTYRNLPVSYFYHSKAETWLGENYPKNNFRLDDCNYKTQGGVAVRSKSELIIGNLLEKFQVPYRYEPAMKFGNQIKYPDFLIMNPFNGKIFLWEHFGALHQLEYARKMDEKMGLLFKSGYTPFTNLIYTFEFDIKCNDRIEGLIRNIVFR